jgi:outer membrane protein OmpA-like peptidoglycan-associated protein
MAESDGAPKSDRNTLLYGVLAALAAVALILLLRTWNRANEIEERLTQAERREELLEARAGEQSQEAVRLGERAEEAAASATEAERQALEAARAQGQAEWDREIARQNAERARAAQESAEAEAATSQERYGELLNARKRELDRMQEALAEIVETERTPLGMVMRLGEDRLQFDFDKAGIRERDKELLSRIAGVLLASRGYRLYVYGHTDDQGPAAYNVQLSGRRAEAVRKYFADAGIPADIMESKGLGEADPRVKGTSAAARQKNRRVEIGIVDTVVRYEATDQ